MISVKAPGHPHTGKIARNSGNPGGGDILTSPGHPMDFSKLAYLHGDIFECKQLLLPGYIVVIRTTYG